ncbi:hypothetical protein [Streptomyces himalayensis]|uniref:Uncharacterized protein n=2 Tax=Streptomyces himalayensis TaxID=2820085 RepID=A0A7W2D783_9ACTN|nr:hypothetical protein [Streptomyces himalayensis]MBA2949398.1 hypothetical protein [Streptomyces himalayensis subsp. himalayensis]MBA4865807.1 hypothetical protein [Streptomyces himalayensis subsp. aureolus]
MPTAVLTGHERTAVQAYLRLLHTVRATLDTSATTPRPVIVPEAALADADRALALAGLAGNEEAFFALVRGWCTEDG